MSSIQAALAPAIPAAVAWNGSLRLLDQTALPAAEVYIDVKTVDVLEDCILRLAVRGAPAIGCAAAFGVVLIAREIERIASPVEWRAEFERRCDRLAATRPTAVNLRWAVNRCRALVRKIAADRIDTSAIADALENEAVRILNEDRDMCERIGRNGAALLVAAAGAKKTATVMTHCNAGALATGGSGTALAVFYAAQQAGITLNVYADETRPLLQGARLTAWELARSGVNVTVICDNMAASVMRDFKPDAVVVGADRIAANGDAANKIGTYGLAVLARYHEVPFYIAAPSTTFDLTLRDGTQIPIEERARKEIAAPHGVLCVPDNAKVFNPAFDVTPAELITAHITEKGVFHAPYSDLAKKIQG
jgi:methylthioribose-1-phosphate isomerase